MNTPLSSQDESSADETQGEQVAQEARFSPSSVSQPIVLPSGQEEDEEDLFYEQEEEEQPDLVTAFVAPFQHSGALPTMPGQTPSSDQSSAAAPAPATSPHTPPRRTRRSLMLAILVCLVVVIGLVVTTVLGQPMPPLQTHGSPSVQPAHATLPVQPAQQPPAAKQQQAAVPSPSAATPMQATGTSRAAQTPGQLTVDWVPQHLPTGWQQAGLQFGDAIQALRTAETFTDREMSLDYRSVGTRNTHGGSLTAATFVLTPAATQRFLHNDVRESSNALFDRVVTTKLIRLVVNPQPHLVSVAQVGQQQFAWVDVAFQLWQSQLDPNNPQQRMEGKELDLVTQQPKLHHMMVLLLHVPPQDAGNNPAMGGTGWLVSTYALDLPRGRCDLPLYINIHPTGASSTSWKQTQRTGSMRLSGPSATSPYEA